MPLRLSQTPKKKSYLEICHGGGKGRGMWCLLLTAVHPRIYVCSYVLRPVSDWDNMSFFLILGMQNKWAVLFSTCAFLDMGN